MVAAPCVWTTPARLHRHGGMVAVTLRPNLDAFTRNTFSLSLSLSHAHTRAHILALSLGSDVSPASSRRDGSDVGVSGDRSLHTGTKNTGARTHTPQLRNTHTPHHRGVGVHPHTPAPEPKFLHQSKACSPAPPRRDGRGDPSPRSKCIYQEYFRSLYLSLPRARALFRSLSLSLPPSLPPSLVLALSLCLSLARSRSVSHTHTHSRTYSLSLSGFLRVACTVTAGWSR
jgi:hypothetical protein